MKRQISLQSAGNSLSWAKKNQICKVLKRSTKKIKTEDASAGRWHKTAKLVLIASLMMVYVFMHAQVITGAISGSVSDPDGAAVPGALVTVTNEATGISQKSSTTDEHGFYSAEGLSAGVYTIDVSKAGFKTSVTKGIQLNPGQRRANNVSLAIGNVNSQVTVSASTEVVNTETSDSGGTISSEQIGNLMLDGRNFETLAIGIPGVGSIYEANQDLSGPTFTGLIVNGNSDEYTTYTIDGIYDVVSGNLGQLNVTPIVDGISQFTVLKDSYSAKYGLNGSGQVIVETKSGTNTYHGSAWDYLRNNAFAANNYFSTTTPALHQNIFGYTLGGPLTIPKLYNGQNRTFFFATNQWYVIHTGSALTGSVFPQAMRSGDFSASPTLAGNLTLDANSQALLASEGETNCITGPKTLNPACFNPVSVAIMNAYMPLPNNPSGGFLNYINENPLTTNQLDYQYRVDHSINRNNLLTSRAMYETVTFGYPYDVWGGDPFTTVTGGEHVTGFNGLVRLQSTIKPTLLNTVGVAETFDKLNLIANGGQMPSGASITYAFPDAPQTNLIPGIAFSEGWSGMGVGIAPLWASDGTGLISDDVNWVKGNHALAIGALYMFGIKRQTVFTTPQGAFGFSGAHTGDPAADYLLGLDATFSQSSTKNLGYFHYRQGEAYVQDDWHATPRLTLNAGLRWQYFSADTESGNHVTSFDPALYNPAEAPVVNPNGSLQINSLNQPVTASGEPANLLNGLAFAGENGVPSGFFVPVKTNFGPRLGFAYDVLGNGKTAIRGGYGIGYTRIPIETMYDAFGQNPPNNQSANVLNSLISDGVIGTAAAPTTQTLENVPFNFKAAQIQSYNLTLEQQIKPSMVATIAYAGSQSRHLETSSSGSYDMNFPLPVSAPSASGCLAPGQPAASSYDFDPCINAGISSEDYTRPYQGYSLMGAEFDEGESNYNALQSGLNYHVGGSQFSIAYTWSKTLATLGARVAGTPYAQLAAAQNMRDWHAEYGPPSYDFTNDFTATWVYPIPSFDRGRRLLAATLDGWNFAGLALLQSGFAMSPAMGLGTSGLAARPNQVAPYQKVGRHDEWFNTSSFAAPEYGFFGDARNGTIRGPGYTAVNVGLYKTFPIVSRFNAEFRAEAFNIANHPNFETVDTGLGDGSYGQVTSAGDPRILELALKLNF